MSSFPPSGYSTFISGTPMASAPPMAAPMPPPPPINPQVILNCSVDADAAKEVMMTNMWPIGLQSTFIHNLAKVPLRYFICDDSGSMSASDGHMLIRSAANRETLVDCSRWQELTKTLAFHAELAHAAHAPTEFRFLNKGVPLLVGVHDEEEKSRYAKLKEFFNDEPGGGTPLCKHINEVIAHIRLMAPHLKENGQKVCVMIATDGESTDGDLAAALRPLKDLPVWLVVRLCTDSESVVNYWNNIDSVLELDMDVLDDLCGEAEEIREHNPWLTYGEPLHRMREFGIPVKELDLLDEAKLSQEQIRKFCYILLGGTLESYPSPQADWSRFRRVVGDKVNATATVWDPIRKRHKRWIQLEKIKHPSSCVIT